MSDTVTLTREDEVIVLRYDDRFGLGVGGAVHIQIYTRDGMREGLVHADELTAVVELFQHAAARAAEIKLRKSEQIPQDAQPLIGQAFPGGFVGSGGGTGPTGPVGPPGSAGPGSPPSRALMKTVLGAALGGMLGDLLIDGSAPDSKGGS